MSARWPPPARQTPLPGFRGDAPPVSRTAQSAFAPPMSPIRRRRRLTAPFACRCHRCVTCVVRRWAGARRECTAASAAAEPGGAGGSHRPRRVVARPTRRAGDADHGGSYRGDGHRPGIWLGVRVPMETEYRSRDRHSVEKTVVRTTGSCVLPLLVCCVVPCWFALRCSVRIG